MTTLLNSDANQVKLAHADALCREAMTDALHRGWYGNIHLVFKIADGTIQDVRGRTVKATRLRAPD